MAYFMTICTLAWLATSSPVAFADLRLDGGDEFGWDTNRWRSQVDGVMGGQSSGSLVFERSDTVMSFSGVISLDGGGFSSVRKVLPNAVDLTSYAGIVLKLETTEAYDGDDVRPPLGLHLQFHDTSSRNIGYASAFAVPLSSDVGLETSVYLPLSSFDRGSRMGFQCDNCFIDFSSIDEIDIYVLFQKGGFDVRVKDITAVIAPATFPSPAIGIASANEVEALINSAIRSGGGLYDTGYIELCVEIYRSTLNTLLGAESGDGDAAVLSNSIKGMICQGLQRVETQGYSKANAAWIFRYTLDGILEELGFLDPDQGSGWRPDANESLDYQCDAVTSGAYITDVTSEPTQRPTTKKPTSLPTLMPIETVAPTMEPTLSPTPLPTPTLEPTTKPTPSTMKPTVSPTPVPTITNTFEPTTKPTPSTTKPTASPTPMPTVINTFEPTTKLTSSTMKPTVSPTPVPTVTNTFEPTTKPTSSTMKPTVSPTPMPTVTNTLEPATDPTSLTSKPTVSPTPVPTVAALTTKPTLSPIPVPTAALATVKTNPVPAEASVPDEPAPASPTVPITQAVEGPEASPMDAASEDSTALPATVAKDDVPYIASLEVSSSSPPSRPCSGIVAVFVAASLLYVGL